MEVNPALKQLPEAAIAIIVSAWVQARLGSASLDSSVNSLATDEMVGVVSALEQVDYDKAEENHIYAESAKSNFFVFNISH